MVQGGRQGPWAGPVKAGDVHGKEVESCLRHQLAFKAARLAKKADRMSTLPQLLRKRKCGINVSGSAAGGDSDRELIGHNDPSWLNLNIRRDHHGCRAGQNHHTCSRAGRNRATASGPRGRR